MLYPRRNRAGVMPPGSCASHVTGKKVRFGRVRLARGIARLPVAGVDARPGSRSDQASSTKSTSNPNGRGPHTASASGVRMIGGTETTITVTRWP